MKRPNATEAQRDAHCAEVYLWRAVIDQAIRDATAWTHGNRTKVARYRHYAQRWLTANSEDFRTVCEIAGLNPVLVRNRALELRAAGWPSQDNRALAARGRLEVKHATSS